MSAPVTITVLVDNYAPFPAGLTAEYGLSLLLEYRGVRVLFDTGLTGKPLIDSMRALGLRPEDVDMVFLSHRHVDHTGGLLEFLRAREGNPLLVISHTRLYEPSVAKLGGKIREIGFRFSEEDIRSLGGRLLLVREPLEIQPGIWVSGEIPRQWGPSHAEYLYRVQDGRLVEDKMDDDMSLYVDLGDGILAVTGCGHAGVENIVEHGEKLLGKPITALVGGLHLIASSKERILKVADYLASKKLGLLAPLHCTGTKAHWLFSEKLGSSYRLSGVGDVITLKNSG